MRIVKCEKGVALIEFLLILPLLFCMGAICLEYYRIFVSEEGCENIAFKTAEWAQASALNNDAQSQELTNFVNFLGKNIFFQTQGSVTITYLKLPDYTLINQFSSSTQVPPPPQTFEASLSQSPLHGVGTLMVVDVYYTYLPIIPIPYVTEGRMIHKMCFMGVSP